MKCQFCPIIISSAAQFPLQPVSRNLKPHNSKRGISRYEVSDEYEIEGSNKRNFLARKFHFLAEHENERHQVRIEE